MSKIGIVYGSTTGSTGLVAHKILQQFGEENADLIDVATISAEDLCRYDRLILGISTWGSGELQEDWAIFLPELDKIDFKSKKVALFGLGDHLGFTDTFVDALGIIYNTIVQQGAQVIGFWSVDNYIFENSLAVKGDLFVGLVIDEDNEPEKTDERITRWVEQVKNELLS